MGSEHTPVKPPRKIRLKHYRQNSKWAYSVEPWDGKSDKDHARMTEPWDGKRDASWMNDRRYTE